ncbi:asparagine synthase (glutamine-hydrolysing) [Geodermatophilus normandii]|uniref:asparagine synthase (glutamine-hydrolyzing) n=1 Tax=Geodermatophilus normandii TaxID=1137989 RepID=A0A317QDF7_9ACTN|nr:asparagine synthase (glutamine-hydrolyzing) [Geodermatophilus normandii]PWW21372.1 asparagine synthase (glutamine-hydrolysing) [Geodermatophilus normandii]
MCGIAGVHRWDGERVDPDLLDAMTEQLAHRGPDGHGNWISGGTGFGHRRLSIIDLEHSAQPMAGPGGRQHLTFNGEVLNYREVRRACAGYPWTTDGDTEAILAAYRQWGVDCVRRLRGQFAFALHDADTGELHLVRDRMGVLPLYWYADDRMVAFASEVKALLPALPTVDVDLLSLGDHLAHRSVPAPHTLVSGVRKLRPGHRLLVQPGGRIREVSYWELPTDPPAERAHDPREAVEDLHATLRAAVEEALVADVPVGAYLSGGIDSSLIVALVSEVRGRRGVSTYAAGFDDPRVDELPWARRVADLVGADHHEVTVGAADFTALLPKLTWHRDAPLSEPADVAVHRLAELARRDVTVVLSGEGSDELFAGYPKYRAAALASWVGRVPRAVRGPALYTAARALPPRFSRAAVLMRALSADDEAERMRSWFAPFSPRERHRLLGDLPSRPAAAAYRRASGDVVRRMLYADCHAWLSDNLLERGDRMSMAASLEMRPPFLDARVVDLAFSLPTEVKLRGPVGKWVVKEVARRYLPDEVVDRRKSGFKVPLDAWFQAGDLRDMARDLLLRPASFVGEVLDRAAVTRVLDDHEAGRSNEASRLWALMGLEVWHDTVVRGGRPDAITS